MAKVYRRKASPYWYEWHYDAEGKRQGGTTNCTERRAAQAVADRREREDNDPTYAAANQATLGGELDSFLRYMGELVKAGKRAAGSENMHKTKGGHLLRLLGAKRLAALRATDVDGYISQRRSEGAAENTINKELITLRCTLKFSRRRGLWLRDVAEVLPVAFAPEYKPRERAVDLGELQRLMPHLTDLHAARAAFMVATGANAGEASRAERDDVTGSMVFLRGTKRTSRRRTVPVVLPAQRDLLAYALKHGGEGLLFPGRADAFNKALALACVEAKIPHVCPNDLRRSFAQWLRTAGVPAELVAPAMGHADTRMVERVYGRMTPEVLGARMAAACSTIAANSAAKGGRRGKDGQASARKSAKVNAGGGDRTRTDEVQRILSPIALLPNPRKPKRNRSYPTKAAALLQQRKRGDGA